MHHGLVTTRQGLARLRRISSGDASEAETSVAQPFSWKDPRFTLADALTGARLIMLPYLIYALSCVRWRGWPWRRWR
ncbi:MAG TPA: hypothetical protein VGR25_05935 [bacterium]|jgi:hypothetical protein|nr:hypothetical protein [bacterium]